MSRAPWLEIQRVKGATIDEHAALTLIADIDDAVARRDAVMLRQYAAEAQLSGMDQEASRAFGLAEVIETKASTSARDELLKIKAALQPPKPSQADLVAKFDSEQLAAAMSHSSPFSVNDHERLERERAEEANRQLRERNARHEAQRRRQAGKPQAEPWWRR